MLGDDAVHHPPEQSSISVEHVSTSLSAQILEFCGPGLFPADTTLQNSEVASSSNCCYDEHSSYTSTGLSFPQDIIKYPSSAAPIDNTTITTTKSAPTTNNIDNFSIIFDEEENDINSVSLDFNQLIPQYQFNDLSLLQNHINIPLTTDDDRNTTIHGSIPPYPHQNDHVVPALGPALPTVCEDDCNLLSSMPAAAAPSKFMRFNPSSPANCTSFMDPPPCSSSHLNLYLSSGNSNPCTTTLPAVVDTTTSSSGGINFGNLFLGELDFRGDNVGGIFCPDPLPRPPVYNSNELQALSNESQHLVNGGGVTPLTSVEITSSGLEAETLNRSHKLTTQERKEKIHRYMKKRNQRNFTKKIKYACRKTLADSRPRVRGRFAKNEEFGDSNNRPTCSNNEEDTDEDVRSFQVFVKEEENFESSSDIFAHISGVNSFKCNYPIQSWI